MKPFPISFSLSNPRFELLPVGVTNAMIVVEVDRVFIRESVISFGDPPKSAKYVSAVDVVFWDREGTRMVGSMVRQQAIDLLAPLFFSRRSYRISSFQKKEPGHGIHPKYHLEFTEETVVRELCIPFTDRVFNLRSPSDLIIGPSSDGLLIDFCGFVKVAYEVEVKSFRGYMERELLLVFETRLNDCYGECRFWSTVHVYLRGSWVDELYVKLSKMMGVGKEKPFLLLKYLRNVWPSVNGLPVVISVDDATTYAFDPDIPEVNALRARFIPSLCLEDEFF